MRITDNKARAVMTKIWFNDCEHEKCSYPAKNGSYRLVFTNTSVFQKKRKVLNEFFLYCKRRIQLTDSRTQCRLLLLVVG